VGDEHGVVAVGIEAIANQQSLYQHCQRLGLAAIPITPAGKDKLSRSTAALVVAQMGRLWLPAEGQANFPLYEVVEELLAFTGSAADHHDHVPAPPARRAALMPRFCGAPAGGPTFIEVPNPSSPLLAGGYGGNVSPERWTLFGLGSR